MNEAPAERGARRSHFMMRPAELLPERVVAGVPTVIALTVTALGLADIAVVVTPGRAARLRALTQVVPIGVVHGASAATAVAGVLLAMLGHGLRRRKRQAWRAAVA